MDTYKFLCNIIDKLHTKWKAAVSVWFKLIELTYLSSNFQKNILEFIKILFNEIKNMMSLKANKILLIYKYFC